jgi:hypothetical protein
MIADMPVWWPRERASSTTSRADSRIAADIVLFDDLVGGREQRCWHSKAEHPGSAMVDG